jgi:hypothetical protein
MVERKRLVATSLLVYRCLTSEPLYVKILLSSKASPSQRCKCLFTWDNSHSSKGLRTLTQPCIATASCDQLLSGTQASTRIHCDTGHCTSILSRRALLVLLESTRACVKISMCTSESGVLNLDSVQILVSFMTDTITLLPFRRSATHISWLPKAQCS